jgi:hypothetical protein
MDRDKMSNLYRGPSIDASYQVSVHLVEGLWPPQAIHVYDCMLSKKNICLCGKGDNSNLNIDTMN